MRSASMSNMETWAWDTNNSLDDLWCLRHMIVWNSMDSQARRRYSFASWESQKRFLLKENFDTISKPSPSHSHLNIIQRHCLFEITTFISDWTCKTRVISALTEITVLLTFMFRLKFRLSIFPAVQRENLRVHSKSTILGEKWNAKSTFSSGSFM
jgi:hypothetical protein